jgi:hypothetical protein
MTLPHYFCLGVSAPRLSTSFAPVVEPGEEPHKRTSLLALRQVVRPTLVEPGRAFGGVEAFFTASSADIAHKDTISPAATALPAAPIIILP